jgi:hypothetical protein
MSTRRARGATISILAGLLVAGLLAACGSASTSTATGLKSAAASTSRTKLSACLKQHGVTLPAGFGTGRPGGATPPGSGSGSDSGGTSPAGAPNGTGKPPAGGGGGGFFGGGAGAKGSSAKFKKMQAALKACGAKLGSGRFGGPGGGGRFKPSAAAVKKFSACVAEHGYTLPQANLSGKGAIYPKKIESDKQFQAAAKSCASDLQLHGARGGGAPPGGSA